LRKHVIDKQLGASSPVSDARRSRDLPPKRTLLKLLYGLRLTRSLEERLEFKLYRQGRIYGSVFTSRGQEALSVGGALAFEPSDVLCPSHRDMGVYLLRGMTVERVLGNYMGREIGPCRGRDGNIHTGDMELGLVAFVSHLADSIPVAAGVALSYRMRQRPNVAGVFFGDGASSRGDFHEGLNFAAVHRLPVVFICNNNQYAYSTPLHLQMAVPGVAERSIGYGFPTHTVDGNDVIEVHRVVSEAVRRARTGGGPTLIEGRTFRMTGHSGHDDASYVPRELLEEWARKDPIERLVETLQGEGLLSEEESAELDRRIEEEIDRGLEAAERSPEPAAESALLEVYSDPPYRAATPPWRQRRDERTPVERLAAAPVLAAPRLGEGAADRDSAVTYVDAIRQGILEEMEADPDVFILGEDIGRYGGAFKATRGLYERFGAERVIDTPISESGIVGAAIGAALAGMRPIVEMQFIDFISCAFDQITSFAAKCRYRWGPSVPIVVRGPCGGGVSGGPYHSQNVESYFLHTPGLKIVAPATARDARALLRSAVRDNDPVLYFEHKYLYRRVREILPPAEEDIVPIGKAVCRRRGRDLSIVTFGAMVYRALEAAETLAAEGAEVEVLDLRTLLPLDTDALLESVARTGKVILLHEATLTGGIGGELAALIAEHVFEYLDGPIRRIAAADTPSPFSRSLESYTLPQLDDVVRVARELLEY
jgi:pyruvate/2-oxoglutarate/acetoin dehydrogenase E1 component/TPP-dependent pyruvate/acetoin dehydrogenase alpha subunit